VSANKKQKKKAQTTPERVVWVVGMVEMGGGCGVVAGNLRVGGGTLSPNDASWRRSGR